MNIAEFGVVITNQVLPIILSLPKFQRLIKSTSHNPTLTPIQHINTHHLPLMTLQRTQQLPISRRPNLTRPIKRTGCQKLSVLGRRGMREFQLRD